MKPKQIIVMKKGYFKGFIKSLAIGAIISTMFFIYHNTLFLVFRDRLYPESTSALIYVLIFSAPYLATCGLLGFLNYCEVVKLE